jgi:hypothetical protein
VAEFAYPEAHEGARSRFAHRLLDEVRRLYPELFAKLFINQSDFAQSDFAQSVIDRLVGAATNEQGTVQLQAITVLGSWPQMCGKEAGGLGGISFGEAFNCRPIAHALLALANSSPVIVIASLVVALKTYASWINGLEFVETLCRLLDRVDLPPFVKIAAIEVIRSCNINSASAAVPALGRLFSRNKDEKLGIEIATTLQEFQTESRRALADIVAVASGDRFSLRLNREAGLVLLACRPGDADLKAVKLSVEAQQRLDETLGMIGSPAASELRYRITVLQRDSDHETPRDDGTPPVPATDNRESRTDSSESANKKGGGNRGGATGGPLPQTQIQEGDALTSEQRTAQLEALEPAVMKAYWAFKYAEGKEEKRLDVRDAYDFLAEHGIEGFPDLVDYTLPSLETFRRYLSEAWKVLDESRYSPRRGRSHGGSIVKPDEI